MAKNKTFRGRGAGARSASRGSRGAPSGGRRGGTRRAQRGGGDEWLYGVHAVLHALANPARDCRRLLVTAEAAGRLDTRLGPRLEAALRGRPIAPETVGRRDLERVLPPGAAHQGVALLAAPLPARSLDEIRAALAGAANACLVALDQVTDPRNVGAVLRAAHAFGAGAVIVTERHAPRATGALAKAAAGALERVPLVRVTNLARALDALKGDGFWCLGLDPAAETPLSAARGLASTVVVLGAEGAGLRRLTRERCDRLVRIPMAAGAESLNVAVSAAVALYALRAED